MVLLISVPWAGQKCVACQGPWGVVSGKEGGWLAIACWVMGWSYAGLRAGGLDGLWNGYSGCWLPAGLAEGMVLKVGERLAGGTLARVNYASTGLYDAF